MGPFDLVQKKGSKPIQAQPLKIRKQPVAAPASTSSNRTLPVILSSGSSKISLPKQIAKSNAVTKVQPARARLQNAARRSSPAQTRLESDTEGEEVEEQHQKFPRKRIKLGEAPVVDSERQIRSIKAFSEDSIEDPAVIQAAEVASLDKSSRYKAAFLNDPELTGVSLQYPSASRPER